MRYLTVSIFVCLSVQIYAFNSMIQWQGPCNFMDTINITGGYKNDNNSFIYQGVTYEYGTYGLYGYIIENQTEKINVPAHYRGCVCKYKPCLRVCCVEGLGLNGQHPSCIKTNTLQVYTQDNDETLIDIETHEYGLLINRPCGKMYELEPTDYTEDQWFFLKNGSILAASGVSDTNDYCFGQVYNSSDPDEILTKVLLCFHPSNDVRFSVYPIGMLFSIPFLIITFCVYAFIPELRNLHGKCLMCYVLSLTILYISLSAVQLDRENVLLETIQCAVFGFSIYICVLLCFFWLNVMCYDIWSTFRGGISRGRGGDSKRFMFYMMYAFGFPLTISTIVYIIDIYKLVPENLLPKIGIKRCWMQNERIVEAIYVYFPISIIMAINIVLYSITAYKIWRVQKETSVIRHGDSQKHSKLEADTDRFFLYLRLFIVMGATWSMESISWVFENNIIFYVSDFLNCVQGFIIFLLFVWKPKIKKLMVKRYRSIRKIPLTSQTGNSSRTETSRISSGVSNTKHVPIAEKPMLED
ncbi:unnamed protein product [Chironomus riparius]|uniref:G-protein coupled receptors family 2 profile 2 domain-containing protein n=1 Tax=Chironomus riparius TaxID=315576 RepID=A0A9N9RV70_9DIPT|nr:unnamed protein product [Chironomus riparius]